MENKIRIYFDNCVVSSLLGIKNPQYTFTVKTLNSEERDAIEKLWDLFKEGLIDIVTSAETRRELEAHPKKYKDQGIRRLSFYSEIKKIPVTSGGKYSQYKFGESKYGKSPKVEEVEEIISEHKGKEMDVKHIVNIIDESSMRNFITLERRLLNMKDILFQRFHIRIKLPSEALMEIQDLLNRDLVN